MFDDEFSKAGCEGGRVVENIMGEQVDGKGGAFKRLMCSFDGCCKSLCGCDVSGEVSAGDFCFPEECEEDVGREWLRVWAVLFKYECGSLFG